MVKLKTLPIITASGLQREVGNVLRRVAKDKEHLIVERDGIPVAVIVPVGDYETLTAKAEKDHN